MSDSSDERSDISTILQYVMRSGQIQILSSNSSSDILSSDDEETHLQELNNMLLEPPLQDEQLEIALRLGSGELNYRPTGKKGSLTPLPYMFRARELGMKKRSQFSYGDRCNISGRILPNVLTSIYRIHGKVFCGTYTKSGDTFISASQDFRIRLYDTHSHSEGILKRTVEARDVGWSILDMAISPDESHFAYCSWSESIHICNTAGEEEVHLALPLYPETRRFCVFAVCFSNDGKEILCGSNDNCLYIYNREINKRTSRILSHVDDVNAVAFADDSSQILISGSDDGLCKVWDRRVLEDSCPEPVGILAGHDDGITYIDSKGDNRYFISNSKDQSIKLWDLRRFSPSSCLENVYKTVKVHNWDYRWQRVPSTMPKYPSKRHVWDSSLMTYRGHHVLQTLIRCRFSPAISTAQRYIITGCSMCRILIYDVLTGEVKTCLPGHAACVRDVSWHPYRNEIMSSSWDGSIVQWTHAPPFDEYDDIGPSFANEEINIPPRRSQRLADLREQQEAQST